MSIYLPAIGTAYAAYRAFTSPDDLSDASIIDGIGNAFTGNLDYQRGIEQAVRAEAVSAREAEKAREFSSIEAEKARQWQEEMRNTAYSATIEDLKRNGINPYAVLSGVSPASTPSATLPTAHASSGFNAGTNKLGANVFNTVLGLVQTAYKAVLDTADTGLGFLKFIRSQSKS